ncbi:MAG: peptidoglycan DD-metalloendopeptidase family protein [Oscillospiraceae bacterium]|nr:peptidoglycan DD-metalloendopeptidase family protein [Oscillospiraceae bacterium]
MQIKGVDISYANGDVDFGALKAAGVEFVIIRCGYGSDYAHQDDERFAENVAKAEAAGMPWGTYLYSYASNETMARSEAQHALRLLAGRKPVYGVWYDVEESHQLDCDLPAICAAFCSTLEEAGCYVGIYSALSWWNGKLDDARLDRYDKWVAQWAGRCEYEKPYGIWQYSERVYIGGKVFDGDWAYKDYPALTGGGAVAKPTSTKSRVLETQTNKITNPFGNGHSGVDLGWQTTQTDGILAHSAGQVVFCQTGQQNNKGSSGNASYGNCVKILHDNGYYTLYAHLSEVNVAYGQHVDKGQQIGKMGDTGNSYGNHLHFEVRNHQNTCIDPAPYIAADLPGLMTEKEEEDMDPKKFKELWNEMRKEWRDNDASEYSKEARQWAVDNGLIQGGTTGEFNGMWEDLMTREQFVTVLYRFAQLMGKA